MFNKLQVRNKILIPMMLLILAGFALLMGYSLINVRSIAIDQATRLAEEMAQKNGLAVRLQLEEALITARTIAQVYQGAMAEPEKIDRDMLDLQVQQVLHASKNFFNFWTVIEPNELDGRDSESLYRPDQYAPAGQYRVTWYWEGSEIKGKMAGAAALGDWYQVPLRTGEEFVTDAYFEGNFDVWMTSVCVPIKKGTRTVGVCGIDLVLESLGEISQSIQLFDTGFGSIIGNNGMILGHKNNELVGKKLHEVSTVENVQEVEKAIADGKRYTFRTRDKDGRTSLKIFIPLFIGKSAKPWSMEVSVPEEEITAVADLFVRNLVFASVAIILVITVAIFFIARMIANPISRLTSYAERVAGGDLDAQVAIDQSDEIGRLHDALRRMVKNLVSLLASSREKAKEAEKSFQEATIAMEQSKIAQEKTVEAHRSVVDAAGHLEEVATRVSAASEELAVQIKQSSTGSEVQKERVMETATAMEEMNATVREVARSASNAAEDADTAKEKAQAGTSVVHDSIVAITQVQKGAIGLKEKMGSLDKQAENIGSIMDVITDIADQTNLLALNAAIEAARAGEAGRGFAIVADEVRKLAEKTMVATQEVGTAISSIQQGTRDAVADMEGAVSDVERSTALAEETGNALSEILALVETASEQVRSIATASEEQSAAAEEIDCAVEEINRISLETADAMAQSSHAVFDLDRLVQELNQLIKDLRNP